MDVCKDVKGPDIDNYPNFALPILSTTTKDDNGNETQFILSQSVAISTYIAEKFDLMPNNPIDKAHALQVVLTCVDVVQESWKMIKIAWQSRRLPKFLTVLENNLKQNKEGKEWFFGDKVSIADAYVADFMRRYRGVLGDENFKKLDKYDLLKDHLKRFESLDKIQQFMKSDKFYEGKQNSWGR